MRDVLQISPDGRFRPPEKERKTEQRGRTERFACANGAELKFAQNLYFCNARPLADKTVCPQKWIWEAVSVWSSLQPLLTRQSDLSGFHPPGLKLLYYLTNASSAPGA